MSGLDPARLHRAGPTHHPCAAALVAARNHPRSAHAVACRSLLAPCAAVSAVPQEIPLPLAVRPPSRARSVPRGPCTVAVTPRRSARTPRCDGWPARRNRPAPYTYGHKDRYSDKRLGTRLPYVRFPRRSARRRNCLHSGKPALAFCRQSSNSSRARSAVMNLPVVRLT